MKEEMLYRKYRPHTFGDVVGQDVVIDILKTQITKQRIGHAYLFKGHHGSGKTTIARIFAQAINCETPGADGSPCLACRSCQMIAAEQSPDYVEIDAASNNGVDSVRELIETTQYQNICSKYKVFIVDEVHMLSTAAFNALLKTLEEPPENVVFIFCTTEEHKVPATIKSRCQIFNFPAITEMDIKNKLVEVCKSEGVLFPEESLMLIAKATEGAMRDAESILDQCLLMEDVSPNAIKQKIGIVTEDAMFEIANSLLEGKILPVMDTLESLKKQNMNEGLIKKELVSLLANRLAYLSAGESILRASETDTYIQKVAHLSGDAPACLGLLKELTSSRMDLRVQLVSLCVGKETSTQNVQISALEQRIIALEQAICGAVPMQRVTESVSGVVPEKNEVPRQSETNPIQLDPQALAESFQAMSGVSLEVCEKEATVDGRSDYPAEDTYDESEGDAFEECDDECPFDEEPAEEAVADICENPASAFLNFGIGFPM